MKNHRSIKPFLLITIIFTNFLLIYPISTRFSSNECLESAEVSDPSLYSKIYSWDSYSTYSVGKTPVSIAIGDVNNDGEFDMVVANNDSNSITIFTWNTTLKDWNVQNRTVGDSPSDVAIGDANNDGLSDIVISINATDEITILVWNETFGDWNLSKRGVGSHPEAVTIGDADSDGLNEIVVANYADNSISIFQYNISMNNWSSVMTQNVGGGPIDVAIGDANNDGVNEIVTADAINDSVTILQWNNINQNFSIINSLFVGNSPVALAIADANNDGQLELLTVNLMDDQIAVLAWNGASWTITKEDANQHLPKGIAVGDVTFDGQNDIVIANSFDNNISVFEWNPWTGDWDFSTKGAGLAPISVAVGDINNDGAAEISVVNSLSDSISVYVWNTTQGGLGSYITRLVGYNPSDIAIGDANNDGEMDIVATIPHNNTVSILTWNELLNTWNPKVSLDTGLHSSHVAIGDVNNDGAQDIVVTCNNTAYHPLSKNISIILWNKGSKTWNPYIMREVSDWSGYEVVVADANNDGANDIIVANRWSAEISILVWNKTSGDWNDRVGLAGAGVVYKVEVGDVNNDGFNDIISSGYSLTARYTMVYTWNTSVWDWDSAKTVFSSSSAPYHALPISMGDVNYDGKNELILADTYQDNLLIYTWNSTARSFNAPNQKTVTDHPDSVIVGDVNSDGQNDIITAHSGYGKISVLRWNESGQSWAQQQTYQAGSNPISMKLGDVNNDGMADAIVANPQDTNVAILQSDRHPLIITGTAIQVNPDWVQDEDFGAFSINLTDYELDFEDTYQNLTWFAAGLNGTLLTVGGENQSSSILTFYSVGNASGSDTFWLVLQDSLGLQDSLEISVNINEINDPPIILSKNELRTNSIWIQRKGVSSFSINLTEYEYDVDDPGTSLNWFVIGLDPNLLTVEGENATDNTLTFHINERGSDTFQLVLIDSEGAIDTVTITVKIKLSILSILAIIISAVAVGIIVSYLIIRRKRRRMGRKPLSGSK